MWNKFVSLSEDSTYVTATLSQDITVDNNFGTRGLEEALADISAGKFYVMEEEVTRFINCAKEMKGEAYSGIRIAELRDASVEVVLGDHEMLASMVVTGAYDGKPLNGPDIIKALADAHVTKGINKLALKKVLVTSIKLKPGETFTQPVAQGKRPIQGKDARFVPMVEDVSKRVLAPKKKDDAGNVDMKNLGETITVEANDPLMKRIPATKGTPGLTVQGKVIYPKPGNDQALMEGKGSAVSSKDPNILVATESGMPIIKPKTVDVESALCLPTVGVATGHVKFKGNVVVNGDIEPDMVVRATGSITVGGFIESADVQAKGDVIVAKGIIGHTVPEGEDKSCVVKSGGSVKANYAQYAKVQAAQNVELSVHCMGNDLSCGANLTVVDASGRQGTLSGGVAHVGGKVSCVNLGVEGDTPTLVEAFAKYRKLKEQLSKLRDTYKQAQEGTMEVVRKELDFKKLPKEERTEEAEQELEQVKEKANEELEKAKTAVELLEADFDEQLENSTIEVKNKVYTHVTVQYAEEKLTTKRIHGPSIFSFNKYQIECTAKLSSESIDNDSNNTP
ncbi:FapA family protein [Vibrio sp. S4M6]|uniref:DUF342 domain-containing protein n=1 Tax=Vibrio sinus TaxID=2946865 RepID=UPI00202A016A|nr:FapA family protein [Vibrio sinus]MCL9781662.1 FapA family protein [Vibrio sinus]